MAHQVAVVIATHNPEPEMLRRAVSSVIEQTVPNRIVVVDDGSTESRSHDALVDIAPSVSTILRQSRAGVGAARNRGLAACDEEFVMCLDDDDWLEPAYCEVCVALLTDCPDAGFAYTAIRVHVQGEGSARLWYRGQFAPLRELIDNCVPYSAMMRRHAFEDCGGFAESPGPAGYEDWDLWLRMVERGWRGTCIGTPLMNYRRHAGGRLSMTNRQRARHVRDLRQSHPNLYAREKVLRLALAHPASLFPASLDLARNVLRRGTYLYATARSVKES